MQCRNDCGPVAMLQVLRHAAGQRARGIEYDKLIRTCLSASPTL